MKLLEAFGGDLGVLEMKEAQSAAGDELLEKKISGQLNHVENVKAIFDSSDIFSKIKLLKEKKRSPEEIKKLRETCKLKENT